VTASWWQ
jgi:transposase